MNSPTEIFLQLWDIAALWSPTELATTQSPPGHLKAALDSRLLGGSGEQASRQVIAMASSLDQPSSPSGRMEILAILNAIDNLFSLVHPRSLRTSRATFSKPEWLREAELTRALTGTYFESLNAVLVPKGPLTRNARSYGDSCGEDLSEHFSSLSVAPKKLHHNQRPIEVVHRVYPREVVTGVVTSASTSGSERFGVVPIATATGEVKVEPWKVNERVFAKYSLAKVQSASEVIIEATRKYKKWDVVLAPEFLVDHAEVGKLAELLSRESHCPSLLVCGTGDSKDIDPSTGLPWNESCILNSVGFTLWTQRKIWPAGIDRAKAEKFGIRPVTHDMTLEASASGNQVLVADIEALGRCIVLICQDLTSADLATDLVRLLQPDWVFVPILDVAVEKGRWAHQHAFSKSEFCRSRFLLFSSTALPDELRDPKSSRPCGLAIGPKAAKEKEQGRLCLEVFAEAHSPPAGEVCWSGTDFKVTKIVIE